MIINTGGDFIAPWHLAPKEVVKEQGAREQWIYLTSTQFSYLKMLGKPTNSEQSTNTGCVQGPHHLPFYLITNDNQYRGSLHCSVAPCSLGERGKKEQGA
jgi:hypothetical protein